MDLLSQTPRFSFDFQSSLVFPWQALRASTWIFASCWLPDSQVHSPPHSAHTLRRKALSLGLFFFPHCVAKWDHSHTLLGFWFFFPFETPAAVLIINRNNVKSPEPFLHGTVIILCKREFCYTPSAHSIHWVIVR